MKNRDKRRNRRKQRGRKKNLFSPLELIAVEGLRVLLKIDPFFRAFHHAVKNGELDRIKIDLLVFLGNFMAMPIQIKGRGEYAEIAIKEHYESRPYILVFRIKRNCTPSQFAKKLRAVVYRILRNPFKIRVKKPETPK